MKKIFYLFIELVFIAFNFFMIYTLFVGANVTGDLISKASTQDDRLWKVLGSVIGIIIIFGIWLIVDIILAGVIYLIRKK